MFLAGLIQLTIPRFPGFGEAPVFFRNRAVIQVFLYQNGLPPFIFKLL